jgi:diguanylate cyclase (GGDEF)-like protein
VAGQSYFQLISPLIFFLLAIGFALIWRYTRDLASARFFAISYFLRSGAFLADYFRPAMSHEFAVFLTLGLYLASGAAFCAGVFCLYEGRVPWTLIGAIASPVAVALAWYLFADDNIVARIGIMNGLSAAVLAYLAFRFRHRMTRTIDRLLQLLFAVNAAQFVGRTWVMLSYEGSMLTTENYAGSMTAVSLRFAISVATLAIATALLANYGMEIVSRLTRNGETDPLTGLLNRRGFDARATPLAARLDADGPRHGFIIADIDGFKAVNDGFGHDAGDTIIARIAHVLKGTARDGDLVARWGGEEFVILIAHGNRQMARLYAEAVRNEIELMRHGCLRGTSVTISCGVTEWFTGDTVRDVYKRADGALYEAKQQGRNRVRLAGGDPAPRQLETAVA